VFHFFGVFTEIILVIFSFKKQKYLIACALCAYFTSIKVGFEGYVPDKHEEHTSSMRLLFSLAGFYFFLWVSITTTVMNKTHSYILIIFYGIVGTLNLLYWYDSFWNLLFGITPTEEMKNKYI